MIRAVNETELEKIVRKTRIRGRPIRGVFSDSKGINAQVGCYDIVVELSKGRRKEYQVFLLDGKNNEDVTLKVEWREDHLDESVVFGSNEDADEFYKNALSDPDLLMTRYDLFRSEIAKISLDKHNKSLWIMNMFYTKVVISATGSALLGAILYYASDWISLRYGIPALVFGELISSHVIQKREMISEVVKESISEIVSGGMGGYLSARCRQLYKEQRY